MPIGHSNLGRNFVFAQVCTLNRKITGSRPGLVAVIFTEKAFPRSARRSLLLLRAERPRLPGRLQRRLLRLLGGAVRALPPLPRLLRERAKLRYKEVVR
jgi:hypothetical protein